MSALLIRAHLLLVQERYDAAGDMLRQHLASDPEDAEAHRMLAICLTHQGKLSEATQHAQHAIGLAPAEAASHYTLAIVLTHRNHFPEAQQVVQRALTIDPEFVDGYSLLALLHFRQNRWAEALQAANQGLELDPDDADCLNARAMAEIKLGKTSQAASTLHETLQRNPDNAMAHANQGWVCLERGQATEATEHFKEALRLDPELEYARAGIVESLKARNFVYRWMLFYFLWMAKLPSQTQWGIVVGGFVGYQVISRLSRAQPEWAPFLFPLLVAYGIFALMTWMAMPLFNLFLRFSPVGRYALSADQRRGANLLFVGLVFTAVVFGVGLVFATPTRALVAALYAILIAMPAGLVYMCDEGWPRNWAWGIVAGLTLLGLPGIVALAIHIPSSSMPLLFALAVVLSLKFHTFAAIAAQFAMNFLISRTVRK